MRTFIISNGEVTDYNYILKLIKDDDYIICADGGTRHAYKMKIKVDLIIGDLDSSQDFYINYYKDQGVEIKKHPKDKDMTDTHICIMHAMDFSSEITLIGALGNRIDHSLANISLLKLGHKKQIPITIEDSKNQVFLIHDYIEVFGNPGDYFSLIPFSREVEGVSVEGAKYNLLDMKLKQACSLGISNVFKNKKVKISIKSGDLIVIKSKD